MVINKKFEDVEAYLNDVCIHADANRESFGFLPQQSYIERAQENRLWVVSTASGQYAGHLIYGGKHPTLKIFQIYISESFKGKGLAIKLIEEIQNFAIENNYILLSARVASDLPANHFWQKAGFEVLRQEEGGKTTGRYINVYVKDLEGCALFGSAPSNDSGRELTYHESPILKKPIYVLDLNLVFDLVRESAAIKEVRALFQAAFDGSIKLCVTPELTKELERTSYDFKNDPMLAFAKSLQSLKEVNKEELNALTADLRSIFFPKRSKLGKNSANDTSDLDHVGFCILHNVDGFVTREKALLRNSSIIKKRYDIEIISPFDFLVDGRSNRSILSEDRFSFGSNEISVVEYDREMRAEVEKLLSNLNVPPSEKDKAIAAEFENGSQNQFVVHIGDEANIVGYSSWNRARKLSPIVECFLYIDESYGEAISIVDHLIETIFRDAEKGFSGRVDLYTSMSQFETRSTLKKRGFKKQYDDRKLSKVFFKGIVDDSNWSSFAEGYHSMSGVGLRDKLPTYKELQNTGMPHGDAIASLFEFETDISPGIVLPLHRPGLILPIKPKFAKQLLGIDTQSDMFASKEALLHVEKLYVRSKSRSSYFIKGGIIVFYVSKEKMRGAKR